MPPGGRPLPVSWFARPSAVVAPDLLNKILAVKAAGSGRGGWRWGRIVEVEAYAPDEPASHAFGGMRPRNEVMFGPPAHLYVYFTYGMHWCANVVTGSVGSGEAVLIRALEPLGGLASMREARGGMADRDLCRGPARLTQALGISGAANGTRLATRPAAHGGLVVAVLDDATPPPAAPAAGPRVGISKAVDLPWRWWVPDSTWVSGQRARPRAR